MLIGAVTCGFGSAADEMSQEGGVGPATKFLAGVGVVAGVLAIWAIVSGSLTALSLLVVAVVVLWARIDAASRLASNAPTDRDVGIARDAGRQQCRAGSDLCALTATAIAVPDVLALREARRLLCFGTKAINRVYGDTRQEGARPGQTAPAPTAPRAEDEVVAAGQPSVVYRLVWSEVARDRR